MSFLSDLRDRYFVVPTAKRILASLTPPAADTLTKAQTPSIFAVPPGFNNSLGANNKRQTTSAIDYPILRSVSINHETTRAAINARKRQITQLGYDVVDLDNDTDPQTTKAQRQQIRELITTLGGPGVRFRELLDKLIEDTLVIDACCFYKQRTRGKQLLRIIPVDPATIKLVVGDGGERPLAPQTAFEQWIRGTKVAELTTNDLTYEMMNPRTDSPYGLSPIESLIMNVDASMRALLYNLNYLSDNNVPQGFLSMPENWTVDQIKEYYEWFNAMLASSKDQAKVFPIPSGTTYQATSKPSDFSFQEFFDYLDRKVCMLFDVQPQELGLNLKQYKENAEGQEQIQLRKGVKPMANFLSEILTDIIRNEWGYANFGFKFTGLDSQFTLEDAKTLIPLGVVSVDEVRNDMGLMKLGVDNFIVAGNTIMPVDQVEDAFTQRMQNEATQAQQPKVVAPAGKPGAKKLAKRGRNLALEKAMKQPEFTRFKQATIQAIRQQITPFTQPDVIDRVTQSQKADGVAIGGRVAQELPTITITGLEEYLAWAASQGATAAYNNLHISGSFELENPKFKAMLAERANYLIDSLDETSRDWLVDQITSGKAQRLTNDEIARQIADEQDAISLTRAATIVNTEVANAMQTAELQTYREQGIAEKQWTTSEDERVCSICAPLDGELEKIADAFSSGDDAPPAHPNCRCYIQAVTEPVGEAA